MPRKIGPDQDVQAHDDEEGEVSAIRDVLRTPAYVADWLGVTVKLLERWRSTGDGPKFVRVTRKTIRYCDRDVLKHIAARTVANTAAPIG